MRKYNWLAVMAVCGLRLVCCGQEAVSSNYVSAVVYPTDGEAWNAGVDYYRGGDMTNALRVLRPLMLSRTHGARASEVVAAIEYARGEYEDAADAAQIALRANPDDARANRNFTRAVDRLPELRKERHEAEVLKAAQGRDPVAMIHEATYSSRELLRLGGALDTNPPPRAVELSTEMSGRASQIADLWIVVDRAIAQSVTNEEQAATIRTQIETAAAKSREAAKGLEDLDKYAYYPALSDVENHLTRFLKQTIGPREAMAEDAQSQTNAFIGAELINDRDWQRDALDYTKAFRARFPAWVREYEQRSQSDTNLPPFTAEDQAKVSALATELEKRQLENVEKGGDRVGQQAALDLIDQIRKLLPKDNRNQQGKRGKQGQQDQQNQQNQQQNQQPNDQQQDDQQKEQDQQEEQQDEQPPDEEEKKEGAEPEEDKIDEADEAVLKRAQERSDEHEAMKKALMRGGRLPPNERDW